LKAPMHRLLMMVPTAHASNQEPHPAWHRPYCCQNKISRARCPGWNRTSRRRTASCRRRHGVGGDLGCGTVDRVAGGIGHWLIPGGNCRCLIHQVHPLPPCRIQVTMRFPPEPTVLLRELTTGYGELGEPAIPCNWPAFDVIVAVVVWKSTLLTPPTLEGHIVRPTRARACCG